MYTLFTLWKIYRANNIVKIVKLKEIIEYYSTAAAVFCSTCMVVSYGENFIFAKKEFIMDRVKKKGFPYSYFEINYLMLCSNFGS